MIVTTSVATDECEYNKNNSDDDDIITSSGNNSLCEQGPRFLSGAKSN